VPRATDRQGRPVYGQLPGLVEALVVDNVDPERLGRVKVKFPTLPETPQSDWARLAMPMAGKERGWMTIPEVGDEVLVSFVHGDVNHAIVVGGLFNGVDTPPYANEDTKNNLRVFQSRAGHRVTFDDTDGAERIELITHNEEIRIILDAKEKTLTVYSGKDITIEAKETVTLKCKDFVLDASQSVSMQSAQGTTVTVGTSTTVSGGQSLTITSPNTRIN
jgi:phage baseplate assembly protein V